MDSDCRRAIWGFSLHKLAPSFDNLCMNILQEKVLASYLWHREHFSWILRLNSLTAYLDEIGKAGIPFLEKYEFFKTHISLN